MIHILTALLLAVNPTTSINAVLSKGGVIKINSEKNVVILRDNLLITLIYDTNTIKYMWNQYIENCESLISNLGESKCLKKVLNDSKESRYNIKEFINLHKTSKRERVDRLFWEF